MCGIAGLVDWQRQPDRDTVERMTTRLQHRGPDAAGMLVCGPVALGHRRLSIIDVGETGNQPMADTRGQHWIVFNGEIYNYRLLRGELESYGAVFATNSDTEVILEAYKRWGLDCLKRFNGMFAFGLWDEPRQMLVLARDRLGKKPLYYQLAPNTAVIFASELKSLRLHPAVSTHINPTALGHYLSLNYTLTDACILDGVSKLPPASYLTVERGDASGPISYWDLAEPMLLKARWGSERRAVDALGELIDDAVSLRLISDVPLGAFLSGGLDSSTIVASMCALRPAAENRTFTIGFDEPGYSEVAEARRVADLLGVTHLDQTVGVNMVDELPIIAAAADEPFADTSIVPMFYLARFARQHVKVCLSGDGGDEAFAGYETYVADKLCHWTRWVPNRAVQVAAAAASRYIPVRIDKVSFDYKLRQFLSGHQPDLRRAHYSWRLIFSDRDKQQLLRPEYRQSLPLGDPYEVYSRHYSAVSGCHYLDQAMYVDVKTWLVDDILTKVDRATMAHSLEARAPLLDYRIVEALASMPPAWRLKGLRKKHLLKEAQKRRLPADVIDRRKSGFNAPVSHWFLGKAGDLAKQVTTDGLMSTWFDQAFIERLWQDHEERRADNGLKLFGLTSLGLWLSDR
jgi:asparagine synthase (glutamine-hydrolysing)